MAETRYRLAFIPETGRFRTPKLASFLLLQEVTAMRAEDILPDHVNQADLGGITIRKGTVAAFLANARVWTDPETGVTARTEVEMDMLEALPALRAVGLFDVLDIRDTALRAWVAANIKD
jgi:hypothetical protein